MLNTSELKTVLENRIHSVFPDLNISKELHFCVGSYNSPEGTYLYMQDNKYQYLITEKGSITKHVEFTSEDDLLYASLRAIICQISLDYTRENDQPGKDFRRVYFAKQIELYSKFGKEFGERKTAEIEEILREHPYPDKS